MSAEDPRLGKGGNDCAKSLLAVGGTAERLARIVMRHAPVGLVGDEARTLGPLVAAEKRGATHVRRPQIAGISLRRRHAVVW